MGMYESSSRQQRAEEPELTAAIEKAWAGVVQAKGKTEKAKEQLQLARWLEELKQFRSAYGAPPSADSGL